MNHCNRLAGVLAMAIWLPACATTKPAFNDAASIGYRLPETAVQLRLDLVLTDCTTLPKAVASVSLTPVARPSRHAYRIEGSQLASFTKQRSLSVDLFPSGAIKSINGGVTDQTGAILVNLIKTAATIVTVAAAPDDSHCTPEANRHLGRVRHFKGKVKKLTRQLRRDPSSDPVAMRTQIDAYAAEAARIETDNLSIHLNTTIELKEDRSTNEQTVTWKPSDLQKWLLPAAHGKTPVDYFSINYSVNLKSGVLDRKKSVPVSPNDGTCPEPDSQCATTIVFREPVDAEFTVHAMADDLAGKAGENEWQAVLPVAQWGDFSFLSLRVGFGGSKTVTLGLDEFGRRTSFSWDSNARGEGISGGLLGIVEAAGGLRPAHTDEDLDAKKVELERLQTQLELNKLLKCEAILDAGGFKCPEE
jgi:hypothetical protein